MFSDFYQLDLHNKTCVCIRKSAMGHQQESDIPWFSYGYQKCVLVDYSFTEYIGPPKCGHYLVWNSYWNLKPLSNLFQTCVFMVFVLWSSLNHTPIKYRCPIKKSYQITPGYVEATPMVTVMILSVLFFQWFLGQCHMLISHIYSIDTINLHCPPIIERETTPKVLWPSILEPRKLIMEGIIF